MRLVIDVPDMTEEQFRSLARTAPFGLAEIRWMDPAVSARPVTSAERGSEPRPRRKLPYSQNQGLDAEVLRRVRAGEPVSRGELAVKFGVSQYAVQVRHERARVIAEAENAQP